MKIAQAFKVIGVAVLLVALSGFFLGAYALTENEVLKAQEAASKGGPVGPPMTLDHGGPDGGGYYFIDSDDDANNAPVYSWIDISGIGTPVTLGDDVNVGPFDLGFTVTYYGATYTTVNIASNGFATFTSTSGSLSNVAIPTAGEPNNLLAIFWDDLAPHNAGQVFYYADAANTRFIISWNGVPHYSNYGALNFQIIINQNGDIIYQYGSMDDGGHGNNGATVGIENGDGTIGTQYLFNADGIVDNMAIYFGLTPPTYADHDVRPNVFVSPTGFGRRNEALTPVVRFQNTGTNAESFTGRLKINHNGEVYNQAQSITNLAPAATIDVTFPAYTPTEEGMFDFMALSELVGDGNPANDTLRMTFRSSLIFTLRISRPATAFSPAITTGPGALRPTLTDLAAPIPAQMPGQPAWPAHIASARSSRHSSPRPLVSAAAQSLASGTGTIPRTASTAATLKYLPMAAAPGLSSPPRADMTAPFPPLTRTLSAAKKPSMVSLADGCKPHSISRLMPVLRSLLNSISAPIARSMAKAG